jgi:hypothetical protein
MGKIGGFKEYDRINEDNIAVQERVSNYNEFTIPLAKTKLKQGSDVWIAESRFATAPVLLEI